LPEAKTKGRISDNKDNSVENGKEAKPEQEFLVSPPPKGIHGDSSSTESCYYSTYDQESYGTAHK
jgi:hypothetical protein